MTIQILRHDPATKSVIFQRHQKVPDVICDNSLRTMLAWICNHRDNVKEGFYAVTAVKLGEDCYTDAGEDVVVSTWLLFDEQGNEREYTMSLR